MRRPQVILDRSQGHDAGGIDVAVGDVVMALDVVEVHGPGDAGLLEEVFQVGVEVGVVHDAAEVALEVAVVHGVETDEGDEEFPVQLGDLVAHQVATGGEAGLQFVQGFKQGADVLLIRGLGGGEAGLVDAVVHGFVDAWVEGIDLFAQGLGI